MVRCWNCRGRANSHHACAGCGRGPMCLKCRCPCCEALKKQRDAIAEARANRTEKP